MWTFPASSQTLNSHHTWPQLPLASSLLLLSFPKPIPALFPAPLVGWCQACTDPPNQAVDAAQWCYNPSARVIIGAPYLLLLGNTSIPIAWTDERWLWILSFSVRRYFNAFILFLHQFRLNKSLLLLLLPISQTWFKRSPFLCVSPQLLPHKARPNYFSCCFLIFCFALHCSGNLIFRTGMINL